MKKKNLVLLSYELDNKGLLYSVDHDTKQQLCIPASLLPDIFRMIHDDMRHCGFKKVFEQLHGLAINKASQQLRAYIDRCPGCFTHQTQRHKLYSNLQSILSLLIFFHIIVINFIL